MAFFLVRDKISQGGAEKYVFDDEDDEDDYKDEKEEQVQDIDFQDVYDELESKKIIEQTEHNEKVYYVNHLGEKLIERVVFDYWQDENQKKTATGGAAASAASTIASGGKDFYHIITENMPRKKYVENIGIRLRQFHWGQRKLLDSEIEFIVWCIKNFRKQGYLKDVYNCLYIGAAPGFHIPYLAKLFPNVTFVLYDPQPFKIKETSQIKIVQDFFNEKNSSEYRGKTDIYISDIRNPDFDNLKKDESKKKEADNSVEADMNLQMKVAELAQPRYASLKFRVSYLGRPFTYFVGEIHVQPWAPVRSTELRIFTDCQQKRQYDSVLYEEIMAYHNEEVRNKEDFPIYDIKELNNHYDTVLEYVILKEYLTFTYNKCSAKDIVKMMQEIDIQCATRRARPYLKNFDAHNPIHK